MSFRRMILISEAERNRLLERKKEECSSGGGKKVMYHINQLNQNEVQRGDVNISTLGSDGGGGGGCLLYTSPSPRDKRQSRMPSSA